jgi:hypothetical protein
MLSIYRLQQLYAKRLCDVEERLKPVVHVQLLVAMKHVHGRGVHGDLAGAFRQHHVFCHARGGLAQNAGRFEAVAMQTDGCASSVWLSNISL